MTLKSLPENPNERRMIWCLDEKVIDQALKDPESRKVLDIPNMVVVQLPITNLATMLNPALAKLQQSIDLKADEILVFDENNKVTRIDEQYITLNKVIDDFLNYNTELARSYSRFCACLGAKSFEFKHSNIKSSLHKVDANIDVDGIASKITDFDVTLGRSVTESLNQILNMSNTFEPDSNISREERIAGAIKIMKDDNLEDDRYCQHILKTFTECFTQLSTEKITLSRNSSFAKNLNIAVTLGAQLPALSSSGKSHSILSFTSKLDIASEISEQFNLTIEVKFT